MDAARIESWLLNEKGIQDSSPQDSSFCLRRPKAKAIVPTACPDRDWTNPNRFSDPLNRSTCSPNSFGLSLPGRPNKAYTWCLDELPWRFTASRSRMGCDNRLSSLFGHQGSKPANAVDDDGKRKRRNGASYTWESVRQQNHERVACQQSVFETGSGFLTSGRLGPHDVVNKRDGFVSFNSMRGSGSHLSGVYGCHLNSRRNSPNNSQRSSPSPSRHGLGVHLASSQRSSPRGSQLSSPNLSPQGTLARLSPGLLRRYSPNARLSPGQHPTLASSLGGTAQLSPSQTASSRSSFVSQWVNRSPSPLFHMVPFSARSSQTSSGHDDDVSFGSETDDDFFYVSCKQLTQGLADLSMTPAETLSQVRNKRVVVNPTFQSADDTDLGDDDDDDFDGCSDDALSDDVFLDNPHSPTVTKASELSSQPPSSVSEPGQSQSERDGQEKNARLAKNSDDKEQEAEGVEHPAVASLRRNSVQSKLRQTWRYRRNKAVGSRGVKADTATDDNCTDYSSGNSPSSDHTGSQAFSSCSDACPDDIKSHRPTSPAEEQNGEEQPETKPSFYYVISPTDDGNMPDVIAVRRSSVELIRWQNSLRRRRRRQAKRHDLGRSKKKEPKQTATV